MEMTHRHGMHGHMPHPSRWLQLGPGLVISMSTCGQDKGRGGWVQAERPETPSPNICVAVTVLNEEFTVRILMAMAQSSSSLKLS